MKVVVIDGQGGKLGALLIEEIKKLNAPFTVYGIGTNSVAAQAMIKAGADHAATGENPVVVACRDATVILGPIGIIAADSLVGEITPVMAAAVAGSEALKLLLPVSQCNNQIVGVKNMSMNDMVREAVEELKAFI